MARAYVFPGQGAQSVGMGRDLADAYPAARTVFEEVDEALGQKLSSLIWEGDAAELTLTANAQPALMAMSIAALRALEAEGFGPPDYVAGHSLGEYSALAAAGALGIPDTARLLRLRGKAMQDAVPVGVGAMAALLGLDLRTVRAIAGEAAGDEICQAANDNDPAQVVISGHKTAVERAVEIAKAEGAKRAVMLPVSAPFHCALMQPAAELMKEALARTTISSPRVPIVSNVSAEGESDPHRIRDLLVRQVTGVVRWRESVAWMAANGTDEFWEVGAGKALSGMIRRIAKGATTRPVATPADVAAVLAEAE